MSGEEVASAVGGKVTEVNFILGDEVKKDQVLFRLDTERLDHEIAKRTRRLEAKREEIDRLDRMSSLHAAQHEAARAKAQAELARTEADVRREEEERAARIRLAELELSLAQEEEARVRILVRQEILPREKLAEVTARLGQAREKEKTARLPVNPGSRESARLALALLEQDRVVRREELEIQLGARRAEWESEHRDLDPLVRERKQMEIRAHTDGVVITGELSVGDLVQPGKPVLAIAQQKGFRIDVAVPSGNVGGLKPGMRAKVKFDAYDYQKFGTMEGTVLSISPDSHLQGKEVFYVVKIALPAEEVGQGPVRGKLRLGMTGQVEIVKGQETLLTRAFHHVANKVTP